LDVEEEAMNLKPYYFPFPSATRKDECFKKGMGWVGLEPTTNALKGRCSTIELPTRKFKISLLKLIQRLCLKPYFCNPPVHAAQKAGKQNGVEIAVGQCPCRYKGRAYYGPGKHRGK
jgi:hypothetical protein